jgi:hypothetical protein
VKIRCIYNSGTDISLASSLVFYAHLEITTITSTKAASIMEPVKPMETALA